MKKLLLMGLALALLTPGCVTKEYVRMETAPLNTRLNDLDAKLAGIENRLSQMPTASEMVAGNKTVLEKAGEMNKNNAAKAEAAANSAEAAATRAETAAKTAETAAGEAQRSAEKGAKLLELQQKK